MSEKEMYLATADREHETTLKILRAYPADKLDLKPHAKSRSARELAWNFVLEQNFADMALAGEIRPGGKTPDPPQTMSQIISALEKKNAELKEKIHGLSEEKYNAPIAFPTGPGKMGDLRRADVLWTILMDEVHHRGQFSVYLRMAEGKVPSIYGPTADEKW